MTISNEMTSLVPRLSEYRSNVPPVCARGMRAPVLQTSIAIRQWRPGP
jgi:hypothetical protein